MIQQSHFWVYIQRNENRTDICTPIFIAVLFTITTIWKQPKCQSTGTWIKMWYIWCRIYNGILLSHEKEWHPAICENMNGPSVKCARVKQILHDITYMWIKKKKRVEKWSTGAREWRNRVRFIKGYQENYLPVQWLGSMLSLS